MFNKILGLVIICCTLGMSANVDASDMAIMRLQRKRELDSLMKERNEELRQQLLYQRSMEEKRSIEKKELADLERETCALIVRGGGRPIELRPAGQVCLWKMSVALHDLVQDGRIASGVGEILQVIDEMDDSLQDYRRNDACWVTGARKLSCKEVDRIIAQARETTMKMQKNLDFAQMCWFKIFEHADLMDKFFRSILGNERYSLREWILSSTPPLVDKPFVAQDKSVLKCKKSRKSQIDSQPHTATVKEQEDTKEIEMAELAHWWQMLSCLHEIVFKEDQIAMEIEEILRPLACKEMGSLYENLCEQYRRVFFDVDDNNTCLRLFGEDPSAITMLYHSCEVPISDLCQARCNIAREITDIMQHDSLFAEKCLFKIFEQLNVPTRDWYRNFSGDKYRLLRQWIVSGSMTMAELEQPMQEIVAIFDVYKETIYFSQYMCECLDMNSKGKNTESEQDEKDRLLEFYMRCDQIAWAGDNNTSFSLRKVVSSAQSLRSKVIQVKAIKIKDIDDAVRAEEIRNLALSRFVYQCKTTHMWTKKDEDDIPQGFSPIIYMTRYDMLDIFGERLVEKLSMDSVCSRYIAERRRLSGRGVLGDSMTYEESSDEE